MKIDKAGACHPWGNSHKRDAYSGESQLSWLLLLMKNQFCGKYLDRLMKKEKS